jgi:hypothetical protein
VRRVRKQKREQVELMEQSCARSIEAVKSEFGDVSRRREGSRMEIKRP